MKNEGRGGEVIYFVFHIGVLIKKTSLITLKVFLLRNTSNYEKVNIICN